tara:strand:- start:72 stop:560 length:489 start_codon:yes stop_codon:yes gene_type:complete
MAIIQSNGVIQVVRFESTSVTNVTSTGEWTVGASTSPTLTTKAANSRFIYACAFSAESDLPISGCNSFFRLTYSTNNFSSTEYANSSEVLNGTCIPDAHGGSILQHVLFHYDSSFAAGTNVRFRLNYSKSQSQSVQFNQQSLSGQPSSTSNKSFGYVMEIGA